MAVWVLLPATRLSVIFRGLEIFKNSVLKRPQALLAILFSVSYCIAFIATVLVPNIQFNEVLSRSFERILLVVVSFYFGAKDKPNPTNQERREENDTCSDCKNKNPP